MLEVGSKRVDIIRHITYFYIFLFFCLFLYHKYLSWLWFYANFLGTRDTKKKIAIVSALNSFKWNILKKSRLLDTSAFSVFRQQFVMDSVFKRISSDTFCWNNWQMKGMPLFFYNPTQIIWITIVVYRRHAIRLKYICTIGAIVFFPFQRNIAWIYNVRFPLSRRTGFMFSTLLNCWEHTRSFITYSEITLQRPASKSLSW